MRSLEAEQARADFSKAEREHRAVKDKLDQVQKELDTDYGPVSLIFIGAMIVAGIKTVWSDSPYTPNTCIEEKIFKPSNFKQGMELGHFELGSTVILAAQKQMDWNIAPGDQIQLGQSLINFADGHGQN